MKKHSAFKFAFALTLAVVLCVTVMAVSAFATEYQVTTVDEFTAAVTAATTDDHSDIILKNDIAFEEAYKFRPTASKGVVTISVPQGESYKITLGGLFELQGSVTCQLNEGAIIDGNNTARVYVNEGSTFILNGGTIQNGKASQGGAISGYKGANIYVYGGTIQNCASTGSCGAIYMNSASDKPSTFIMTGGTIQNCTSASWGGGIGFGGGYVNATITGGTITGCEAGSYGGGMYLYCNLTAPITDLTVSNNTAHGATGTYNSAGGGVAIEGSAKEYTFGSGTVISGNTAEAGRGGGIAMISGKSVVFDGAQITGNRATSETTGYCGGVFINGGNLTVQGETLISENTAQGRAGGIGCQISNSSSLTITGGTISNNTAGSHSGGVEMSCGTFTMTGGTITGNTAGTYAGGILVSTSKGSTITGGTISNNTSGTYAGGINIANAATNTISGITVTGNTAGTNGGGFYIGSAVVDLTISDVAVIGNTANSSGGGVYFYGSTGTIENSTVEDNRTRTNGGAFAGTSKSAFTVKGSFVNNNVSYGGGGAVLASGTATFEDTEFKGNACGVYYEEDVLKLRSTGYGGSAIYVDGNGKFTLKDVTVVGNGNAAQAIFLPINPSEGNGLTLDGKIIIKDNSPTINNYDAENKVFTVGEDETVRGLQWSPKQSEKTTLRFRDTLSADSEIVLTLSSSGSDPHMGVVTDEYDALSETDISAVLAKFTVPGTEITLKQQGSNVIIDAPVFTYTLVSVNNGESQEYSGFISGASVKLPSWSDIVTDFTVGAAYEGYYALNNFIGYAEVENYGTAPALKALYYSGHAVAAEDINGKTLYAAWAYAETAPGASVKLPGESGGMSGIRFVTLLETDILAKIGIKNLTAEESANGDIGYRLGVTIYKDPGEETQVKQTYYGEGGKSFDEKWYGDDLYTTVYPSGSLDGKHAFSIGLALTPVQYEYKFAAEAFVEIGYTGGDAVKRSAPLPTEGDPAVMVTRTARQVAIAYAGFLASENNDALDETYLGLTEAQMTALEQVSGLTFNASTKTFA